MCSLFCLIGHAFAVPAFSATVTYNQRIAYYSTWGDGGGAFDNGADEVGMYANFSAKQTAAWRYFKTAGNVNHGGGTDRALRHGDEFTITVYGDSPFGNLGVAILDGPSTGSWANRHSNARGYVQTAGSYGNWFVHYNGGSTDSTANIGDEDDSIELKITSSSTFNARVDGGSWLYNLPMQNSPANTDLVDSFSIYYSDDYSGTGNENAYWKQTTSVENQGTLQFGGTTDTTPGYINDGLAADSTSTASANKLFKFGTHNLMLVWTNDFSGGTQIEAGSLRAGHDRAFGAVPGSVDADNIIIWGGGTLELTNTFSFAANRGFTIDAGTGNGIITVSSAYTGTIAGIVTSDASAEGLIKIGAGGLTLSGANTYIGSTFISNGVLRISHGTGLGTTAGNTTVLPNSALELVGGISSAEPLVLLGVGVAGAGSIRNVSGSNTNSGTIALSGNGTVGVDSSSDALTLSGVISASSATNNLSKTGAGVLHLTANNTFASTLVISGGVVSVSSVNASASANQPLGAKSTSPSMRLGSTAFSGTDRGTLRFAGGSSAVTPKTIRLTEGTQGGIDIATNGVDLEISGVISIGSTAASIYKTGAGRLILSAVNTYEGQTRVEAGVLRVTNADGLGNAGNSANQDTYVSSGAAVEISGGITVAERFNLNGTGISSGGALRNLSGSNTVSGRIFLDGAARINSDADWLNIVNATAMTSAFGLTFGGSGNVTISTPMNTGANTMTKDGSGTLVVSGVNTYSGATTVNAGTLIITGTSGSSAHTIASGGTLRGNNTVGALTVNGLVAPGLNTNDPGTLVSASMTIGAGGKMVFDIGNVSGTPGVNWDLISCAGGAINVSSSSGNPFEIVMKGNPTGWDNTQDYSWKFIDGASVSSYAIDKFSFVTTEFTPSLGGGTFSVTNSGSDLFISFTAAGGPDIEARGNGLVISDGDTSPTLADHTDFGDVVTAGGTLTRTYTFTNAGVASVGLGTISFSGGNSGDFTVVNQLPDTLASGGSTNIQITFDPGADGTRNTTLTFTNTVVGKETYTFAIQGTGVTYNLDVLGNSTIISDGDATPSLTDHTDFGAVGVNGGSLIRTFTINNTGNREIGIGNVAVGGTHAADFTVTAQPADSIALSGSTTFQVTFDPSAVGLRDATLSFTNTSSSGKTPYNFSIQGTGAGSGISNFPTSLSFSSVLGSLPSPSFQAFSVTNVGLGTLTYSLTTNTDWLIVSNVAGSAAAGAGNVHTALVQVVTGMAAGTSNATITITGTDGSTTNSPKVTTVTWTISAIPQPSAVTVQGEGPEFTRIYWTKDASYDVLILHRATNAPAAPANSTSYNIGDSIGSDGTRVIYKGAAAYLDHVVIPGTTNHYAFYSINNNFYSPAVTAASTNRSYSAGVVVDTFSYTNGLAINTRSGGIGWSGAWGDAANTFLVNTTKFTAISGYPAPSGNTITGNNASIRRSFTAITSGKIYASFMMRTDNGGGSQYSGLSFYDNTTEEKFIGEGFSQVNQLTVGGAAGRQLANNTDYTIIVRYDFGTDVFSAILYTNASESVPSTEPVTWHVTETDASVSSINRIRLESNVGTRWDEIRIATNYYELLEITPAGPAISAGPAELNVSVMKGSSGVAAGNFSVTNVGGSDLIYTNYITYGAGSGWLSVAPSSATVIGGATRINTGTVSAVGLATGLYVATNRVDGNQTNAAALIVYNMTVTNVPVATAVSAFGDGTEMVRVLATAPSGLNIMIVHRGGQPPSADPSDNTPYSLGDAIGSGTVIYSGSSVYHEHVVTAGSTNFYRVYSINNNHYSPYVEVGVTTAVYRVGEIVESFAYTNNVTLGASHSGGQGWSGAWSIGSGTWIVKTNGGPVNFTDKANYPSNTANRIRLNSPGNGNAGAATRTFATPVTNGTIFVAAHISFQFNGADKWMGINFMSNGSVRAFFGEVGHADNRLGLSSFGSTNVTGTYNFNDYNTSTNNTYLVVGAYNFETRELKVASFYRTITVPKAEPVTWDAYGTVPANYINSIDAIRLSAGSSGAGNLGDAYYDEIRVATSWAALLGLSQPVATNYVINGGSNVTDGQIVNGTYSVVYDFYDTAGMTNTASLPNFDIFSPTGTQILTNQVFASAEFSAGGISLKSSNATHAGAAGAAVVLGVYTSRWTAANSNGNVVTDSDSLSNGTKVVFTVVDDDTTGPVHSGFTGMGRTLAGGTYTNTEFGSGLFVTGLVTDAQSGVYGSTSNKWTLYRGGSTVNNGSFTAIFSDGTAVSSNGQLTATIVAGDVSTSGNYTLRVVSVNYDLDRGGADTEATTNDYEFTVVPAAQDADVFGNNVLIPDADTTPTLADHTDFSDVLVDGGQLTRTYTITNSGSDVIGIGTVTTNGGGNPTNFIVVAQPASSLAIGATTTFQVLFDPSDAGTMYADIEFTSTVSGVKNPYSFRVQGTGTYVEIAVTVSGAVIADGDSTPNTTDGTDFGIVGTAGATSNITYTITNSGNRAMSIGNVTTSGTHAADFIVTSQPGGTLNPSNTTSFTVQFNPSANGLRSAALSFTTTDDAFGDSLTENPFNFDIQGTGAGTGISNFPTTLAFSSVLGSAPSPTFQAFSVTNVGLGTLTYSLTTNADWLSVSNVSGSAAAGAGNVHTAIVSLVAGMAAGTSNATITITGTDGFTTNSPKTIAVSWTISALPDPTAQTATTDGPEMVRLAWTKNASYDVMIVYDTAAVSTDPTQGTAYSVGNTIGTGRVIYKGSGATLEHIVPTGAAAHYKFYSVNNNYYSPGVTANATTASYLVGELVDQFSYTNAVGLQGLNGGQGWSSAWSIIVPRTNTDAVVDAVNFATFQASWPTERGNRIVFKTTNSSPYEMSRDIPTVTCGQIYVAVLMRRQFNESASDAKYQLLRFMDGTNVVGSVGDRGSGDDQFGVRAGATATLYGSAESFPAATDHLVIGSYDFDSGIMAGIFYTSGTSVPSNEPTYFVTSTGTASQITSIGLAVGAGSGWVGEAHFDELRVARNWGDLLNLLSPKVTNYLVDADNIVTDGQMTNGTYEVRVDLDSAAGVDTDGTPIATTFDLLNPSGTAVVNNDTFGHFTYNSASSVTATDVNHAITSANNALGVYTVRVSAVSSNGGQIIDNRFVGNACTGTVMSFTVNDDDAAAPTFGVIVGQGRDISGAVYTNNEFIGGFWVTGTVTDVFSGLFAASNTFTLSRDGSIVSSGVFAVNFADGGATAGGLASNNFPLATMAAGAYTLTVFAVDYDIDRPSDQLKGTNVYSFSVVDPPAAPGLAVGPLTLTYSAMLGSNPDVLSTFGVTNVGSAGTLIYTNYQTYGSGANGWFAANPTNNSLAITADRLHTGHVASTSFTNTGVYVATNRVDGNQTNLAQEIVITLTVTNIPSPTAVTATPSGAEFVTVNWTESSGRQVLIVSRETNAPAADPTNGTSYAVGNNLGGGQVVYKGSGTYFEQVVRQGSTNFYNVYTINNDRYSLVTTVGATTTVYVAGVIVETFSYTNSATLNAKTGGFGWTNAWLVTSGGYGMSTALFSSITGYPADAGNVVTGDTSSAYREFAEVTSGKLYVSYKFRVSNGSGYAGLSFFNNAAEQMFFGERGSGVNEFAVDGGGANESIGGQLANNTDYTIIGMYDFDNNVAKALIYTNSLNSIPAIEPVSWHAQISDADPTRINRVRLESGSGTIVTKWDEIRIATTWDALLVAPPTYIWDAGGGSDRDWSTAANWTANTEPTATNNAFIGGSYTGVVTVAGEVASDLYLGQGSTGVLFQTGGSLGVNNLYLGFSNGAVGVYTLSGGSATVASHMVVGAAGAATATVNGAAAKLEIGSTLQVGMSNAVNRAYFVQGAGTVTVANVYIGKNSATEGRYTMTGGVLVVSSDIFLADGNANSTGRLDVSGGRLDSGNINVGRNGLGLMTVSGTATINVIGANSDIVIGDLSGNNNTNRLTISGGVVNVGDNIELGDAANTYGSMLVSGGSLTVTGMVLVADVAGSTGLVSVTGGNVLALESLIIGNNGLGQMNVHGGSVTASIVRISDESGAAGSTLLVGGGRLVADGTSDFEIDYSGTATVTGGVLEAHDIDLGIQAGALATLNLGGSGTVIANNPMNVGDGSGATGIVNQTGGTLDLVSGTAVFNIGETAGSFGYYTITNGVITTDHNMVLGSSGGTGTGVFHVVGGLPSITIGDGTTEDFTMQSAAAELKVTFVDSAIAQIRVQDDINVAGTLTISNVGPWAAGSYVIATSLNSSAIGGTFSSINWLGNVTGTVTYTAATIRINVDGNILNPTAQSATADGREMVRLAWTPNATYTNVMIIHRSGSPVATDPTQGVSYNVGDSIGSGTVIYKGSGSALEHIVSQGTTHYYEFYSRVGNYYSTGVTANATTEVYDSGELVEQFAYTNDVPVNGLNGGQGWTNAWVTSAPNAPLDVTIGSGNFAAFQPQWPSEKANRIVLKTTNSSTYTAERHFAAVTSGKIYVAALYRREFGEGGADGKFSGIRLVSGGSEQAFFGERGGAANEDIFGVSTMPGTPTDSTYGSVNSFNSATEYLIIGRYDFTSDIFDAIYYTSAQSVPSVEPTYFVSATNASISSIDGVSLVSGATSGWNGQVAFDELRVATSWEELLRLSGGPYATNYTIGVTNYVSDGQIRAGSYSVVMDLRSSAGVETVSTTPPYFIPNYDIFNPSGMQIVTDILFSTFAYIDAGQTVIASNGTQPTVEFASTMLGVHTSRWSAISSNGLVAINRGVLSNSTPITFTVFDDDTTAPTTMTIHSPEFTSSTRSMHVSSNNTAVSAIGGTGSTNISYRLTDHYLANHVSNATPLVFYFGARDADSGLSRGTTDAATQSSLTIGSAVISNVFNWDTTRSSAFGDTTAASATSAWAWVSAFLSAEIDNLVTNNASGVVGSNRVTLTWHDADNDRASDRTALVDVQHGWLVVEDEDTAVPEVNMFNLFGSAGNYTATVAQLLSGTGWSITGRVRDTTSGINVNGTSTTQPNISPYFELWDATGTMQLRQAFDELSFSHGGATTYTWVRSTNNSVLVSAPIGVWTAKVVVADADFDRTSDRAITTNEFAFTVIVGDSETSMAVSPTALSITSYYGTVSGGSGWPNFTVTNQGIGPLIYSATISYIGGSGWLTVNPNTSVNINTAGSQIHTAAVNVASLNPGTYQAVVALAGNQTNGTKYVTNNLTVIGYYVGEIVDQFTNTAGGSLHGANGGTGWTNTWNSSTFTFDSGNLSVPINYPTASGNKICGSTASEITASRYFPSVSTGKLFAAVAMRKDANDNNGYAGISLMEGGVERAFAGKTFNSQWLGIDFGGSSVDSSFGIYQSTYLIVIYYDFDNDTIRTRAFNPGDTLSLTEPGTWSLTRTNASIASIDGIRVGGSTVGNLCLDEVRVARTWETLLNQFTAEPTLHASALTFTSVTTNAMTVGWTPGNGGARIVIAREGQAVTFSPIDGSNYTANADFIAGADIGSGQKIIYNGSGNSVNFISLTSNTQYFFRVFEYNAGGVNYYTNGVALNGSRWTLVGENSEPVTNFVAYTGGDTTATNVWTIPGGSVLPDGYVIYRRNGSPTTDVPVDGVAYTNNQLVGDSRIAVINSYTITNFLQTNLTSCATYYYRIFPYRINASAPESVDYLTNTPATASASTTCVEPAMQASNITFTAIGTNTITLTWANGDGTRRMVVVRGTNAVNQHPVDGMSYTSSATFGSGTHLGDGNFVVYRDTGSTVTVVGLGPGITYNFRVYEFTGSGGASDYTTNTAVNNPRSTATASFGLVFEPFAYGNFENLSGKTGGTGWTNSWSTAGGLVESSNGNFPNFGAYPPDGTSVAGMMDMGNFASSGRSVSRNFPAMTSGRIYISLKISSGSHSMGTSDYLGVDLLSGGATTGFFGKASGVADRRLAIVQNGVIRTNQLDGSNSGYQINSGIDYLMVAMYDFNTRQFQVRAYTQNQLAHADPDRESAWSVEMTNAIIDRIDGIKIVASDNDQIVSFDSIRIGPSWEEVMWGLRPNHHIDNGPVPTLVYIGTNYSPSVYGQVITNLSDAELKSANNIDFAVRWDSPLGVFITNAVATNRNIGSPNARVNPNWDPLAVGVATNQFNLDRFFTNFFGFNGFTSITTYQYKAFNITNINFENQYFVTVSAENDPGGGTVAAPNGGTWDAVPTNRAITINTSLRFYVYDDDTNEPLPGANGMVVMTNNAVVANVQQIGDIRRHFVTDGVLASNGMDISIRAYDTYSGIQRTASGDAATNMNVTVVGLITNDTANYVSARSSSDTTASTASNTWSFANTGFTWQKVTDLWGGDGSGSQGQDFDVMAFVPDADNDRVSDQSALSNELFGVLRITDDDTAAPTNNFITYGGISVLNRSFYMGTNGFAIGSGDTTIRGTYNRRSGTGADTIFAVTDEEMASSGSRGLEFAFGAIDVGSGISRATSGSTNDVMSFSVSNVLSGVVTGYNATLSTTINAPGVPQTNVWTFSNGQLTELVITQLMEITGSSGSGAAMVSVTLADADNDRQGDRSVSYHEQVGYLQVFDDDVAGPTMAFIDIYESTGGDSILATSFETSQSWPVSAVGSGITWTNVDSFGTWIMEGVSHTSLDPKNSGTRRLGFLTNSFNNPWIQLPPVNNPGALTIYGARVSGGSGAPGLVVQRWDGAQWVSYTTNLIDTTTYLPYTWEIDEPGSNVLLRIRRVDAPGVFRTQIYADDISINARSTWIGTNSMTNAQININWTAAIDDYSGIEDYHIVPPAIGSVAPTSTNSGNSISAALTSMVQSVLGQQGVITGFIFAVDDDSDRSNDRTMGNVVSTVIRIDTNPPVAIQEAQTIEDSSIDDTTEIKVTWSNHTSEAQAAGWRQSDSEPLSDWDSYVIRYHELDISSPVTTELTRSSASWSNVLNNHLFTNMILSNLNFDARYAISIMGRDGAGNIGPAVTVTGITTIFSVTQGFNRVDSDLEVQWIWNEERTYDVVYVDALSMSDSFTNLWKWVTTITNAGYVRDTGNVALARSRPTLLSDTMRFYRVSREGVWTTNNATRRGSVEVYVTKPLNLYTGENWHSLFFIPDTATVSYVFNTNILPAGATFAEATKISWFEPTAGGSTNQNGSVTASVWLASSGQWLWQIGGTLNSNADDKLVPLDQGFLIEIPGDNPTTNQAPAVSMMIIGLVPTQQTVQAISGGSTASNRIHVLSHNMPVRVPLSSMGFRGSGFVGNNNGVFADEIRILSQGGHGSLQNPKARIRLRSDGVTWQYYTTPAAGSPVDPAQFIINPDDAVIVVRRNSSTMLWTNKLWYTPPTKNFTP